MFLNIRVQVALLLLAFASSSYCDLVQFLEPILTTSFTDSFTVYSVNWCTCQFLAAGGADSNNGLVGVYQFDQINETLSLTVTATLGSTVNAAEWCSTCKYLAVGGQDFNHTAIIQIYGFDSSHPGTLETVGTKTTLGGSNISITSLDWCSSCSFLAAATSCVLFGSPAVLQVYSFDSNTGLSTIGNSLSFINNSVDFIKWCSDCSYLAITISQPGINTPSTINIYGFDKDHPGNLVQIYSLPTSSHYTSIDWCSDCGYIVLGGNKSETGYIDIYRFDSTPSLTLIVSTPIVSSATVYSLEWCQDCENLAAVTTIGATSVLQLYHFDPSKPALSSPQTYSLNIVPNRLDWCDNCNNLAVGGSSFDGTAGLIQLFEGIIITAPTNLTAQKIYHRFPTQVDIINQLCWNAVYNAVAYNVYADAALTMLLATIPSPSVCYSQHQISAGKTVTYYVTAVNASGSESAPAVVTI